jgi:hypothetical protein
MKLFALAALAALLLTLPVRAVEPIGGSQTPVEYSCHADFAGLNKTAQCQLSLVPLGKRLVIETASAKCRSFGTPPPDVVTLALHPNLENQPGAQVAIWLPLRHHPRLSGHFSAMRRLHHESTASPLY